MNFSVVVMGVCGSGKTTLGKQLSVFMGLPFVEGDDYHSQKSIGKMSVGTSLTDQDRHEWLCLLGQKLADNTVVLACSALKRDYRDLLRVKSNKRLIFVSLDIERAVLEQRLRERSGHFAGAELLDSQFEILEPPDVNEDNVKTGPECDIEYIADQVRRIAAL